MKHTLTYMGMNLLMDWREVGIHPSLDHANSLIKIYNCSVPGKGPELALCAAEVGCLASYF